MKPINKIDGKRRYNLEDKRFIRLAKGSRTNRRLGSKSRRNK